MASRHCISFFITLAVAAAGTPGVFAAPPTDRAPGKHAPERPDEPAAASQMSAQLDAQIAHLRAIRERLSRASSDEERRMLLAERDTVMRDAMATMHGPARARTAGPAGKPGGYGAGMCYDATQQHVALMQEMMLAIPDGRGAGMPKGAGPGPGMHRGMMAQ
ncbi:MULTISPECIES: hypothetical protein [Cupriavidus]|uniref:Uncharacterized protein n=1 Tax=Cupriavidus pinatubonensis (strain JMP 134 / LMG 1197) TaxID=264198 RepID=Q472T3_CUPPJ|nr:MULTISPECIES: hypothetical protein [Cupriavidus]QYY32798.1 hypothetical protein K2O51_18805 [Cupriavidus pinatubonensis]